jgi:non-ribosomal peptide synthetase component F
MSVLTVYIALVLRWCRADESVFQYEFDGRVSPESTNTIGYFASALYLRLELLSEDRFPDLLTRVVAEYCRAYEHADFSWMAAQLPRPQFARNTVFNWVPQASPSNPVAQSPPEQALSHPLKWHAVPFDHPVARSLEVDNEPSVLLFDTDTEIVGGMYYPRKRFPAHTMERFTQHFLAFIQVLLREPGRHIDDIMLS